MACALTSLCTGCTVLYRSLRDSEGLPSQEVGHIRSVVEALWRVLAESPSTVLPAPLSPLLGALAELSSRLLANCDSGESPPTDCTALCAMMRAFLVGYVLLHTCVVW